MILTTIRVDVDVQNDSLIANKIGWKSGCWHITKVLELSEKYNIKIVWSLRSNVLPDRVLIGMMKDQKHEVLLHANTVLPENLIKEKETLEKHIEMKVRGSTYHSARLRKERELA